MRKQVELEIPTSWSDITLTKYLTMQKDIEAYVDDEEAQTAFMIYHLCGIDANTLKKLSAESFNIIREKLEAFTAHTEHQLKRIITVDGIEYGFEPNLSKMSYGAYADITKFKTITIDENWCNIMSILYRPVIKKQGENYAIKSYDGEGKPELFKDITMDIHFGTLFFFCSFVNGLTELYPELYDSDGEGSSTKLHANFSNKWGNYTTIIELANGNVQEIDNVVKLPLEQCLLYLAYKADKGLLEKMHLDSITNSMK